MRVRIKVQTVYKLNILFFLLDLKLEEHTARLPVSDYRCSEISDADAQLSRCLPLRAKIG